MIKTYILPVKRENNTDIIKGIEHIHNAFVTYDKNKAILIQNTTPKEDTNLTALALKVRETTNKEKQLFLSLPKITTIPPNPLKEIEALKKILKAKGVL
ncbi:hypothetical protein CMI37_38860 [Candidatus Pacearchaeota archaeon]|nr:hypothetical protein [Candidatus Pacearchaeota archaeon]|tara:strand:- start:182 stop:478 length:297 start_codon:yes stop_codon:yes gene_type:complete